MGKLRIIYNPYSDNTIADGFIDSKVEEIIADYSSNSNDYTCEIANEMLIDGFRAAVVEKLIDCKDIIFVFKGEEIKIDPMGNLSDRPSGFMETHNNLLFRLI